MTRSNRGAATVSAAWLISIGVLFLAAVAFAFIAQSEASKAREEADAALQQKTAADALVGEEAQLKRDISRTFGWLVEAESADPKTDVERAKQALVDLRSTFTDLTAADDTFEKAMPKITAAYNQQARKIAELETQIQTAQNAERVARQAVSDLTSQKDETISQLRSQLADEQQNASEREAELQQRLTAATNALSEKDLEQRRERTDYQQRIRELTLELRAKEARIGELAKVTRFTKEPFNQYPDGKVIAVSPKLNLGWIDLGANNRLTRGTRFRVETSTPGARRFKAMAEVTRVESNRAEVLFSSLSDQFDPVAEGDVVINPLYDPAGGRNAVLVGRFSGAFSESELKLLLSRMGIHVQDHLDNTTHFLIVGSELFNDPDTNEPLEEPLSPSDLPVYKDAEANGVQIIPLQDIREFFRVDAARAG